MRCGRPTRIPPESLQHAILRYTPNNLGDALAIDSAKADPLRSMIVTLGYEPLQVTAYIRDPLGIRPFENDT